MAVNVRMAPATEADAYTLALNMRPVEIAELEAANGRDPLTAIMDGIERSDEAWAVFIGNELACIWGVVEESESVLGGRRGVGWLLTTSAVERYAKTFWATCLQVLPDLMNRWGVLVNDIDARHAQAVRWARRLGFSLGEPRLSAFSGLPFYPFSVTAEGLCANRQP